MDIWTARSCATCNRWKKSAKLAQRCSAIHKDGGRRPAPLRSRWFLILAAWAGKSPFDVALHQRVCEEELYHVRSPAHSGDPPAPNRSSLGWPPIRGGVQTPGGHCVGRRAARHAAEDASAKVDTCRCWSSTRSILASRRIAAKKSCACNSRRPITRFFVSPGFRRSPHGHHHLLVEKRR